MNQKDLKSLFSMIFKGQFSMMFSSIGTWSLHHLEKKWLIFLENILSYYRKSKINCTYETLHELREVLRSV